MEDGVMCIGNAKIFCVKRKPWKFGYVLENAR